MNFLKQHKSIKETNHKIAYELWYSDSVIFSEIIFNSFKYSGISNSFDGGEEDQFREYSDKE